VTGIDIVDPTRVTSRYPQEWLDDVLSVPVIVEDVLSFSAQDRSFDLVTCVSTLEHIGFDQATAREVTETVFERAPTIDGQASRSSRSASTDQIFLDVIFQLLEPGGRLLLTVPVGADRPVIKQDSLGLFTYFYEYGPRSLQCFFQDSRFTVSKSSYFELSSDQGWLDIPDMAGFRERSSDLQPYANGCACLELTRV